MSSTRNFEFRVPPKSGQRAGRYAIASDGAEILIGAPIKVDTAAALNDLGLPIVELATGAQAPVAGLSGICVYEFKGAEGWAGDDPYLTTYSDKDKAPVGAAVQLVSGDTVKVCLRNTNTQTFLATRSYAGRTMISEGSGGATPNLNVGDYLTPGDGSDVTGYWAVTANAANAWMVVVGVDDTRGEVEARLLF
jgi:hypothetical protein